MSSSSRSRNKGHYPDQNHGSEHYKRPHGSGGFFGKIMEALSGSRRHSRSSSASSSGSGHNDRHSSSRHRRRNSWS